MFEQLDATRGAVDVDQVDWKKTTESTSLARSVGISRVMPSCPNQLRYSPAYNSDALFNLPFGIC
jgi:hypothetical protein